MKKHAFLIAGMHRSGTSALTRVLSLLGVALPQNLMPAAKGENALGFWESKPIMQFNDTLLEALGSSWDDWSPLPAQWTRSPLARKYHQQAIELLEQEFNGAECFILKDPRICRLLPFWIHTLRSIQVKPYVVIPFRHPLEVAASLHKRNQMPQGVGLLLWLRHVLDAIDEARYCSTAVLSFDALLQDWKTSIQRLSQQLGFIFHRLGSIEAETQIDGFLQSGHKHFSADTLTVSDDFKLNPLIEQAYDVLCALEYHPEDRRLFEQAHRLRQTFAQDATPYAQAVHYCKIQSREQHHRLQQALEQQEAQAHHHDQALQAAHEQYTRLQQAYQALEQEYQQKIQAEQQLQQRCQRLEHEYQQKIQAEQQWIQHCQTLEASVQKHEALYHDLEHEYQSLKQAYQNLEHEYRQKQANEQRLEAQYQALIQQQHTQNQTIAQLESQLHEQQQHYQRLHAAHQNLQNSNQALHMQLEDALATSRIIKQEKAQQVSALHTEKERLQTQLQDLLEAMPSHPDILQKFARKMQRNTLLHMRWKPPRWRDPLWHDILLIAQSNLFSEVYYLLHYPDVLQSDMHPIFHYCHHGWKEGRNPSAHFDTRAYLEAHPELLAENRNPLIDFIRHRSPS